MAAPLLEDKLTCSICLGPYRDPVTLPCGHSFCARCIRDSWRCCDKTCPECREPFPAGTEPRRNVALNNVLEVLRGPRPAPDPEPRLADRALCPRHGRPLEFFCRTEGLCVCGACTVNDCRRHEVALLDVERREREVTPGLYTPMARWEAQGAANLAHRVAENDCFKQEGRQGLTPEVTLDLVCGHMYTQNQLRARVEVTLQQITLAKTQLQELQQQNSLIKSSACTLASVVSSRFSSLLQALEKRQALTLRDIKAANKQALAQVLNEIQRLTSHLEALEQYDYKVRDLLEQVDDRTFFQELQQLSEPLESLGPLTPPQWDEDQQLRNLKELLSPLCDLLLEEEHVPRVAGSSTDPGPLESLSPLPPVPNTVCPLRKKLWQNYRNLTFDPDTANRYFYLSHQDLQVTHGFQPQGPARPGSFELWQVQCAQSFQTGRHYWEVRASDHSVTLGVTYPKLTRQKLGTHTDNIGRGPCSWGLCIQEDRVQAWHNGTVQRLPGVPGRLLGMDLNLTSGCLTFYSLEPHTQPLYTFHAIFNQPLYPVFWLLEGRTLTLCHQPEAKLPPGPQEEVSVPS